MKPDPELLALFARTNSEDAFAELVKRHVNLVFSAALRQVGGDAHLAQDVAQTVFADLARKAGHLRRHKSLTGWLYTSAHFAAAKLIRGEVRRRGREETFMREPIFEPAPDADWDQIRPVLDDAMHELRDADREAVLLRYFENRPFAEVGARLGLNENAARMRVERALEKLRGILARRGVTTASAFAAVLSAHAVQVAPANLTAALTATATASAKIGTLALFNMMTTTQLKLGLAMLVVAGGATAFVLQQQTLEKVRTENGRLQQRITQLEAQNTGAPAPPADAGNPPQKPDDSSNELLKLRGEVGVLQRQVNEAGQKARQAEQDLATFRSAQTQFTAHESAAIYDLKMIGLAMHLYQGDHQQFPTNFEQITNELGGYSQMGKMDVYAYDFVNPGSLSLDYPRMVAAREKFARQAPDGTWRRLYCLVDGSVQTATTMDGNFDAWEKINTTPPPPNQN